MDKNEEENNESHEPYSKNILIRGIKVNYE
jgi:hypothetical protein